MITIFIYAETLRVVTAELSDKAINLISSAIKENKLLFTLNEDNELIIEGKTSCLFKFLHTVSRFYDISLV